MRAAEMLGISLKTLYNRLREYQAQAPEATPAPQPNPDPVPNEAH